MISGAHSLLATAILTGGLRVEAGNPDALCPAVVQVREAVEARLGNVEGPGEWLASYNLVHRPDTGEVDVVRLDLHDPERNLRLRRDIPRAGASCSAVAQAMVLVLESFFRRTADPERGVTAPVPQLAASAPAPPVAAAGSAVALGLLAGWTGGPSSPALALDARLVWPAWAVGAEAAWLLSEQHQQVRTGTAMLAGYALRGYAVRRIRPGDAIELFLGPEMLLALERAETAGIPDGMTPTRAVWGVGARAGVQLRLGARLALRLAAAADFAAVTSGTFVIDNVPDEIFPPARWRLLLAAGLIWALG
jgi:hypothetical protein